MKNAESRHDSRSSRHSGAITERARWAIPFVAVALLANVPGIARAGIPDEEGVIHACYTTRTGVIRVIDASRESCRASETAIDWDQQSSPGPQGLRGAQGPAGPSGPSGPVGPEGPAGVADVYIARLDSPYTIFDFNYSGPRVILSLPLPTGSYAIQTRVVASSGFDIGFQCSLSTGDATLIYTDDGGTLVLQDVATFTEDTTIDLSCSGNFYVVDEAVITAFNVTNIH